MRACTAPSAETLTQEDLRVPGEAVALLEGHRDVEYTDARRVISGVMEDIYTPDIDGYSPYPNILYACGTLETKTEGYAQATDSDVYFFKLKIHRMEETLPEYTMEPGSILGFYLQDFDGSLRHVFEEAVVGERYLVKGQYGNVYGLHYSRQPPSELITSSMLHLLLRPQPESGCYLLPAPPEEDVMTDAIRWELAALEQNIHTVFLRTTKDMSALLEAESTLVAEKGRLLNREDDLEGSRVCVVRREFAQLRGLDIGDSIALTMRGLQAADRYHPPDSLVRGAYDNTMSTPYGQISGAGINSMSNLEMATGYITDYDGHRDWRDMDQRAEVFQIVGIYDSLATVDRLQTLSWNHVYIPDSCVPADWVQDPVYTGFSVVLSAPGREKAVLQDLRARLDAMGFWLEFPDSGWDRFAASVFPIRTSVLLGVVIFSAMSLAVLYLLTYLYFRQRRQEFAIMRALGGEVRTASRQTMLPLLAMSGAGIVLGSAPAWYYALDKAADTLSGIAGAEYSGLSPVWLVLLMALLFLLCLLMAALSARSLGRRPVLELLQGKRQGRAGAPAQPRPGTGGDVASPGPSPAPVAPQGTAPAAGKARGRGTAHTLRFAWKRALRMPGKSALTILVSAGFLLVLSWMPASIGSNVETVNRLYDTTVVTGEVMIDLSGARGGISPDGTLIADSTSNIPGRILRAVLETGYIGEYYADSFQTMTATLVNSEPSGPVRTGYLGAVPMAGISGLARFEEHQAQPLSIDYEAGFGPEIFEKTEAGGEAAAIISRSMMEGLDARPGDYLALCSENRYYMFYRLVGTFEDFTDKASQRPVHLLAPLADMQAHTRQNQSYNRAEFRLDTAKNRELALFREEAGEVFSQPLWPKLKFVLRDYVLTDVVEPLERNIQLMELLYPVAVAVAAMISAAVGLLPVLQSVEDAAKMRVLGTPRAQVCGALVFEQGLLWAVGTALGGIAALAWLGAVNPAAMGVCFGCCAAAAFAGALSVLRKKPLELLQVKE